MSAINCTQYPAIQPNPDISGNGVLASFLGTAHITLLCCIAKAILDHKKVTNSNSACRASLDRWSSALGVVVVNLSDQQIITGLSVMIGGLSQLEAGIQAYHWQSIVNLAWCSSMTHLLTLSVLRNEVRSNKAISTFRILGMGMLIGLLICVMIPLGYLISITSPIGNFPAWCLYRPTLNWRFPVEFTQSPLGKNPKAYNWIYIAFTSGVLVYGFLTRIILLSHRSLIPRSYIACLIPDGQPLKWIERLLQRLDERESSGAQTPWGCFVRLAAHKILYAVYAMMIACYDLYGSKTWEITWLSAAVVWGTLRIFAMRAGLVGIQPLSYYQELPDYQHSGELLGSQNSWSFGQVICLGLFALPLVNFFGVFFSHDENTVKPPPALMDAKEIPSWGALFFAGESSSTSSPPISETQSTLYANPWYGKLLWLWYLYSLGVLIYFLRSFAAGELAAVLVSRRGINLIVFLYFEVFALDFMVLFCSSLLFLDSQLQQKFRTSRFGNLLWNSKLGTSAWVLYLLIVAFVPGYFMGTQGIMMGVQGFLDGTIKCAECL
ncbi:hypothetical protein B0J14DRAFT_657637 [Halenospora varia]|nr:hypothetical protein B0J14DRAFT_657637 [Halenospora varia]